MKDFDIKRGHFRKIDGGALRTLMEEKFGDVSEEEGVLAARWGALDPITVVVRDRTTLSVETNTRTDVDEDTATETIRRYNQFMEAATGFSAKERKKRAEKASKGD